MRYKLKTDLGMKENEIIITLKDLKYMNDRLKRDNKINGFIFGFEKVEKRKDK